jgi:hypothetical protein
VRLTAALALLVLAGCSAGRTLPLAHTSPSDSIWPINPGKWVPEGGSNVTLSPAAPAGRLPDEARG